MKPLWVHVYSSEEMTLVWDRTSVQSEEIRYGNVVQNRLAYAEAVLLTSLLTSIDTLPTIICRLEIQIYLHRICYPTFLILK